MKDKKLFHSLLDLVLEKQDSEVNASIDMNVSTLGCTAAVWLMNVEDKKITGAKEYYTRTGDGLWVKTKDGKTETVRDEDVLEALRNA
jgi:hypothetical protein|nr:MAG TPA: hypothetical protein [Caudoviricetes sp.]